MFQIKFEEIKDEIDSEEEIPNRFIPLFETHTKSNCGKHSSGSSPTTHSNNPNNNN